MSNVSFTPTSDNSLIEQGDACAARGDWSNAVEFWQRASDIYPDDVRQRLMWLLRHAGQKQGQPRYGATKMILAASFGASIAFLTMVVPEDPGTAQSNILAVVSWVFILVSVILVLSAAHTAAPGNLDRLLSQARLTAQSLDQSASEETIK